MRKGIKLAALAAIGALLACSCVKEITEEPKQYTPESGVISFVLNGISTRADSETPIQTYTYNLGAWSSATVSLNFSPTVSAGAACSMQTLGSSRIR